MFIRIAILLVALLLLITATVQASDRSRVIYHAQMRLMHYGYNPGPADGIMGRKTRRAIASFQWDNALEVTGSLNQGTLTALGLTIYNYAQIGAARLKVLDIPPQEFTLNELLSRVKKLNVRFNGSRDLMLYDIDGFSIHTGHINKLIQNECIRPYEISIGEMYVRGQTVKMADYGDIFANALQGKLQDLHNERSHDAIKYAKKEIVLICTAAMF